MNNDNCFLCDNKTTGQKYNPYNVTFSKFYFGENTRAGMGYLCSSCAKCFIEDRNQCKGGHWVLHKTV